MLQAAWRSYKRLKDGNSHYSVLNNAYLLISVIIGGAGTAGSLAGLVFSYISGFWANYGWAGTFAAALTIFFLAAFTGTFIALLLAIGEARRSFAHTATLPVQSDDQAIALLTPLGDDRQSAPQKLLPPVERASPVSFAFASGGFGSSEPFRCAVQEPAVPGQQQIYEDLWLRLTATENLRNTRVVISAENRSRTVQQRWEPEAGFRGDVNPGENDEFHISRRIIDNGDGNWILPQGPNQRVEHDFINFQVTVFHAGGLPVECRFRVWFRPGWVPHSAVVNTGGIETIDTTGRVADPGMMFLSGYS